MKKLLVLTLAITAVMCFGFAGCKNGKCDECGTDKRVEFYEQLDGEYCFECAVEEAREQAIEAWQD